MLYITFKIKDAPKFEDFKKVFNHMRKVREPNFKFEAPNLENIDWSKMKDEDYDALFDDNIIEYNRYKSIFPDYAKQYFTNNLKNHYPKSNFESTDARALLNYIEFGFEVDLDALEIEEPKRGIIKFSTGNFPFGGLDLFILVLNAFDLKPIECFDGFTIFNFNWTSNFEYEAIDLPEKTKAYLDRQKPKSD